MTIEQLLDSLKDQITYLANSTKIPGMDRADVKQEIILNIIIDFNKLPEADRDKYKEGWWFKRMKWFVTNLAIKESKEPVNRSIRLESLGDAGK